MIKNITKQWGKRLKRMDIRDVGLAKASIVAFTLFLITIWPALMDLVNTFNHWYFFAAFVILTARPVYKVYLKK